MSERFADRAARLAGIAGVSLGWRPDEFWRATPAELAAIFGAFEQDGDAPVVADDLARLKEMFPDG
jgi:uncharacterized phage protein (TIGR02216 family)